MNERTNLYRKLGYLVAMAALLFPLSILGSPRTASEDSGGRLAEYRADNGLSQGNLGEIDPASETIKLATLGLRGVAVNALWHKANQYKMKEDWGNLTATLEQLSKLQPNFITFWKYQAWNLTYNVSVEFDDYRDRYYYVRRGINFLKEGETYNRDNPQILWELGWFIGQKIGRADEKVQYRRLFRSDETYHPDDRPQEERDNWLVSKEWYIKGERAAESRGIGRKSPIVFYSSSPKSQMNYAEAIEDEGRFDRGLPAWRQAGEEWSEFGNLPIEHSTGVILQLNDEQYLKDQVEAARQELIDLAPDVTGPYLQSLEDQVLPEQREAMAIPETDRTPAQMQLVMLAEQITSPSAEALTAKIIEANPDLRVEALLLQEKVLTLADRARKTKNYKTTANFDYWKLRCEFEQSPNAVNARRLCYQGKMAMVQDSDPIAAKALYEEGMQNWRKLLDEYPDLRDSDGTTGDDILEFVKQYAAVLEKIDEEIPDDFPMWDIVEDFDTEYDFEEELIEHKRRMAEQSGQAPAETADAGNPSDAEEPAQEGADPTADDADPAPADGDDAAGDTPADDGESPGEEAESASADAEGEAAEE